MWLGWPVTSLCPHRQYYWYDERGKKVKCTAPQYVDFVMSSVQKLVTDEDVFPTKYGRSLRVPLGAGWAWLHVRSRQLPDLSAIVGQDDLSPGSGTCGPLAASVGVLSRTGSG